MHVSDFDLYKDLLKEKSGLIITPDKSYLLDSRLTPVAKKWAYENIQALTEALRGVPKDELVNDVVEAMTTNETSFFRDNRPFDSFKDVVLPYLLETRANTRKIRIWCAACSSGQEPYSLAMILKEQGPALQGWTIDITATDISHDILNLAKEGLYSQFEVQRGLPIQLLMKYFTQEGEKWRISDEIKKMITYKYFNLLEGMGSLGQFDLIFCRNVLIYFDAETKGDILERMSKIVPKDAFLYLGGAETVFGITEAFKPMPDQRGIFVFPESVHAGEVELGDTKQTLAS